MIVRTRIEGSRLVGNLLGDPSERDLVVYLPPGYDDSERRYPTAYLLHALGNSSEEMVTPETDGHDRLDNLRKLRGILLDVGSNDDYNLHWGLAGAPTSDTRSRSSGSQEF